MKVNLGTHDFDDFTRRAIAHEYGKPGLATRCDILATVYANGFGGLDETIHAYYTYLRGLELREPGEDEDGPLEPLTRSERAELARWG